MIWRCDLAAQYLAYKEEIDEAIERVLRSGRYVLSENVAAFEKEFAAYVGCRYGVGVNSGTDALMMALWSLNLHTGDEVITTPFTAIPTYSAIRHAGAKPVFVDIEPDTFLMDLDRVKGALTERTRAVVAVHLFGNVLDVERLRATVGADVRIIEDCAQSHGASIRGKMSGALGDVAAFSFYPTKNLGAYGDGGMVVTNDRACMDTVRLRRTYGMISKDEFVADGINSRLDELQAAVLRVKLRHLDAMNARRRELAALYAAAVDTRFVTPQTIRSDVTPNYHVYSALCADRDQLVRHLEEKGIQSNVYYPMPLSDQRGFRSTYQDARVRMMVAAQVSQRIIALPFYPELPREILENVASAINDFYQEGSHDR